MLQLLRNDWQAMNLRLVSCWVDVMTNFTALLAAGTLMRMSLPHANGLDLAKSVEPFEVNPR